MTLIDQFVVEIIIEGNCKLCDLEKMGLIGFRLLANEIATMIVFSIVDVPTNVR